MTSSILISLALSGLVNILLMNQVHVVAASGYGDSSARHECFRTCEWPPRPKICRYEFTMEWFNTMSSDCFDCPFNLTDCNRPQCIPVNGYPRAITVVNKQFPGPSIQVCEHDTIEVKVRNNMINGESIAIHWHGMHQRGTPYMDGVPLVTQCPVPYRASFTYRFKAETVGTFYWHAQGVQRAAGACGMLVVRQAAPNDVHSNLYDHDRPDHVVILQDWVNQQFMDRFSRIFFFFDIALKPDSILINGNGWLSGFTDKNSNKTVYTPRHVFHVTQGQRYRFRTVSNVVMECPLEVSVDGHNLTVIASDGAPVEPLEVRSFGITSGERYDFILDAKADVGKYWMRVKGRNECGHLKELALLVYDDAYGHPDPPEEEMPGPVGVRLNIFNMKSSLSVLNTNDMKSAGSDEEIREADVVHYVGLDFKLVNNDNFNHPLYNPAFGDKEDPSIFTGIPSSQINSVTFRPPSAPLLTQHREISEFEICSFESTWAMQEHCKMEFCECTHVLEVELGKVVELVLVDEGRFLNNHPMHIHGYRFQVLARDKLGQSTTLEDVMRLDKAGNITRRTRNAPLKDTVPVPDGGYVVIRFLADNPGWWLFHCHVEVHFLTGMYFVIHVGSDDDLPPIPRDFPRCGGDWYPEEDQPQRPPTTPSSATGTRQGVLMSSAKIASCFMVLGLLSLFGCWR